MKEIDLWRLVSELFLDDFGLAALLILNIDSLAFLAAVSNS